MRHSTLKLDDVVVAPETSLAEALAQLDRAGIGALAICDEQRRLAGLLTDGDIRRALLRSLPLSRPCSEAAQPSPIFIARSATAAEALSLMNKHDINHLPVVDAEGRLSDLLRRHDLVTEADEGVRTLGRLEVATIMADLPLSGAISRLELAGTGALLLCDEHGILVGLLTDGDLRRAVLRNIAMTTPSREIASRAPVTAPAEIAAGDALRIMNEHDINHLPVIAADGRLSDLLLRKDLVSEPTMNLAAVIMAGGKGRRLLPLTRTTPKPMLALDDHPLLERTINQLSRAGITNVHLATHHLAEHIIDHFGDGRAHGVNLRYSREDQPLGTAGGIKLVDHGEGPVLVLNGDILTGVSFRELLRFHREHRAELTVGVRKYEITVPFGVIECDEARVRQLREKPTEVLFINAGVYLLEPSAIASIPDGVPFDMTDLIQALLAGGRNVVSFPILEYWLDIGRPEDYQQAQDDVRDGRI